MIFNFGSINVDYVYQVPHLVTPGETLSATGFARYLGGKGANQSLAIARAGAKVKHMGAMSISDDWIEDILSKAGVDTSGIKRVEQSSGHAIIYVDKVGENCIVIVSGANELIDDEQMNQVLALAKPGDWVLLQNETNAVSKIVHRCKERGLQVAFNPAPFDAKITIEILPFLDLLIVNETESEQLQSALGGIKLKVPELLTTLGARGARLESEHGTIDAQPFKVKACDTTGAGDTFIGYFLGCRSQGLSDRLALQRASAAAALSVTVRGAGDSIPVNDQVDRFLLKLNGK